MTYLEAARHAQEAVDYAESARALAGDTHERRMAQATEELALAVKALAQQLHRDN